MTPGADTERQRLIELLRTRSFQTGRFRLSSGRTSAHYIDARPTTMSASGLYLVGRLGLQALRAANWAPVLVGGLTLGADPVAYAMALASLADPPVIDAFTVRKQPKGHGAGRRIEGAFEPGATVVVVEDVITTGASVLRAVQAVREAGASVLGVLAVVDRDEGGRQLIEAQDLPVTALVALQELVPRPS